MDNKKPLKVNLKKERYKIIENCDVDIALNLKNGNQINNKELDKWRNDKSNWVNNDHIFALELFESEIKELDRLEQRKKICRKINEDKKT